ncbi:DUF3226 domain-containing protein [Sediminibacterium sp. TEGAF015]|uniref:DUF3226 domain-containing protein n=1 Tax=Sediminibacterium sp. TEGAF015 TaxID=575378 RepID=UPI002203264A|nr:DUF3226 domain-containing protein [Sediminibacterium sp. TEGAF015]BDQ11688.1 hypothetical protein TEGAF0_09050 [Sediminibacterium sp. TEGAF015]
MQYQIFTEGDDIQFIKTYCNFLGIADKIVSYVKTEGWTKIPLVKTKFLEATNSNITNIVIFDADNDIDTRRIELYNQRDELNLKFELFLQPNNIDNGCFEDLVLKIIPEQNIHLLTCFDAYENCINSQNFNLVLSKKSKFYAYVEATNQNSKKIQYDNNNYWNLESDYLNELKSFLINNII